MTNRLSRFVFAALLLACATLVRAQVQVAISPNPFPQFLDASGKPVANGFLYTYQAGTITLSNTYIDSTGTVQNPDPIPLDATGAPSNGSTQTGIWLANQAYKFCLYTVALVQIGCKDNVTGYLNLLNLANSWTFAQTFSQAISDTLVDNQMVFGSPGTTTTLDFPPPVSNVVLHFPTTNADMVGRATTDTLTNKTLTSPTITSPTTTGTDVGIETLTNKTLTAPAITGPVLNAETVTQAARYFISCYKQVASGGGGNSQDCLFVPDKAITLTRVIFGVTLTAPVTCTFSPHYGVFLSPAGATVADTGPLSNGAVSVDSGALSSNLSAGTTYAIGETANDSGCGTHAGPGNITVEYKMQ